MRNQPYYTDEQALRQHFPIALILHSFRLQLVFHKPHTFPPALLLKDHVDPTHTAILLSHQGMAEPPLRKSALHDPAEAFRQAAKEYQHLLFAQQEKEFSLPF